MRLRSIAKRHFESNRVLPSGSLLKLISRLSKLRSPMLFVLLVQHATLLSSGSVSGHAGSNEPTDSKRVQHKFLLEQTFLFATNYVSKGSLVWQYSWNIDDRARIDRDFDFGDYCCFARY